MRSRTPQQLSARESSRTGTPNRFQDPKSVRSRGRGTGPGNSHPHHHCQKRHPSETGPAQAGRCSARKAIVFDQAGCGRGLVEEHLRLVVVEGVAGGLDVEHEAGAARRSPRRGPRRRRSGCRRPWRRSGTASGSSRLVEGVEHARHAGAVVADAHGSACRRRRHRTPVSRRGRSRARRARPAALGHRREVLDGGDAVGHGLPRGQVGRPAPSTCRGRPRRGPPPSRGRSARTRRGRRRRTPRR